MQNADGDDVDEEDDGREERGYESGGECEEIVKAGMRMADAGVEDGDGGEQCEECESACYVFRG